MSDCQLLAECIDSGQASAEQVSLHTQDAVFAQWYRTRPNGFSMIARIKD